MATFKIKILLMIFLGLLIITNLYGFLSIDLMPIVYLKKGLQTTITLDSFFNCNWLNFWGLPLIVYVIYSTKEFITYYITSFIVNIFVLIVSNIDLNIDNLLYAFSLAGLSAIIGGLISLRKNKISISSNVFIELALLIIMLRFLGMIIIPTLYMGMTIVPTVNDAVAILIDSYLHIPRSINNYFYFINDYIKVGSLGYLFFFQIYSALSIMSAILIVLEYKYKTTRYYNNTLLYAILALIISLPLYFLFPIMGPKYFNILMEQAFPNMPNWMSHFGIIMRNNEYARNGMPSMHIGLSLFLFLNTRGFGLFTRSCFGIFFLLTALATLVLGEHYIIDWFGALPIIIIAMTLTALDIPLKDKYKIIINNTLFAIVWYMYLWKGMETINRINDCVGCSTANNSITISLYALIISAVSLFIFSYRQLNKLTDAFYINNKESFNEPSNILAEVKNYINNFAVNSTNQKLSLFFFFSGFAGLMYQVIFGKMLGTIFGSTSIAIYIVLATYMIGLSLGAWIGGKEKSNIPVLLKYAFCELGIALYCLLTPIIFPLIEYIYSSIAIHIQDNMTSLIVLRVVLGILGLIIPTTLMGMTTPILLKHFNQKKENSLSLAHLYTLNTLGAALGAIFSGYFIIQMLGIRNSILMTVFVNLLIGMLSIKMFKKENITFEKTEVYFNDFIKNIWLGFKDIKLPSHIEKTQEFKIGIFMLFCSGIVTMCLETLFIHGLAIVVGNSVYAFSIMLFTFLLGLGLGSIIGKNLIENNLIGKSIISLLQFILGLTIFISFNIFDLVPTYLSNFEGSNAITNFTQKESIRFLVCFIIMILPTICIGALYPLLMNYITQGRTNNDGENIIGVGMSINTVGNILGVFFGGLVLINLLGLANGLKLLTLCTMLLALLPVYKELLIKNNLIKIGLIIGLFFIPFQLDMNAVTNGANVYFTNQSRGEVVNYTESIDGGLTSVNKDIDHESKKEILTLLTNGKFQGNNSAEMYAQGGFSIIPMMHTVKNDKALIIGYGTGMSANIIEQNNFKNIDIVDLSSDIILLANKYFPSINHKVTEKQNVNTHITDGRNFLRLTNNKYDLISMEITSIWFAGASYLYNKEFYHIAKEKLSNTGVLQQWVQMHHMRPNDFLVILNTIRSEFKHVSLYYIGGQGVIVATNSDQAKEPIMGNIIDMNNNTRLTNIREVYGNDFKNILPTRLLSPIETNRLLTNVYGRNMGSFYSTDNNLYLEYNTPKGNAIREDTAAQILTLIKNKK